MMIHDVYVGIILKLTLLYLWLAVHLLPHLEGAETKAYHASVPSYTLSVPLNPEAT